MNIFKSPILWAIIGIALLVFGFMTSDETKYPTASKFSGWLIVGGGLLTGFASANIIKWSPLTKISY